MKNRKNIFAGVWPYFAEFQFHIQIELLSSEFPPYGCLSKKYTLAVRVNSKCIM